MALFEIYETEDGLHHHLIESKDIQLLTEKWLKEVRGETLSIPIKKLCRVYGTNHDREAVTGVYHRRN